MAMVGSRWMIVFAAFSGLVCVGVGAMGSHSLPKRLQTAGFSELDVQKKLGQCEIAVKYQMYHSLAILAIGLSPASLTRRPWKIACWLFFIGILLFSGGLYSMVFWDAIGHWSIVPMGGGTMMAAWIAFGIGAVFPGKNSNSSGNLVA
jgi:uncharacterized membrane protein YgdD (TMEM256/DUF423 family)